MSRYDNEFPTEERWNDSIIIIMYAADNNCTTAVTLLSLVF